MWSVRPAPDRFLEPRMRPEWVRTTQVDPGACVHLLPPSSFLSGGASRGGSHGPQGSWMIPPVLSSTSTSTSTAALSTSLGMAGPAPDVSASTMGHWPVCLAAGHRVWPDVPLLLVLSAAVLVLVHSNPAAVRVHPGPTNLSGLVEMCVTTRAHAPGYILSPRRAAR